MGAWVAVRSLGLTSLVGFHVIQARCILVVSAPTDYYTNAIIIIFIVVGVGGCLGHVTLA